MSSSHKAVVHLLVFGTFLGVSNLAVGQELLEVARKYAERYPGRAVVRPSPPGHYEPKTVEQLTNEAVAVVQGTLSRIKSYVGGSLGDRVLTDYSIVAPTLVTGNLPSSVRSAPGPTATPLVLTVFGGEVVLEGVTVRSNDINRAPIENGAQYLVFLRPSRGPSTPGTASYEIHYGAIFEVSQDRLKPLLNKGLEVFPDFANQRPTDMIVRIQKAAQAR